MIDPKYKKLKFSPPGHSILDVAMMDWSAIVNFTGNRIVGNVVNMRIDAKTWIRVEEEVRSVRHALVDTRFFNILLLKEKS